jgi:hypothetical protein
MLNLVTKTFDQELKGFIFNISGQATKLRFPKSQKYDLGLIQ